VIIQERTSIVRPEAHAPPQTTEPGRRRGWLVRRALATADLIGLLTSFAVAQWLFAPAADARDAIAPTGETLLFLATLPVWLVVAKLHGLYDRDEERTDHSTADDVPGVFHMVTAGVWLFFIIAWLSGVVVPQVRKLAVFWLLAIVLVTLLRLLGRALCRRHGSYLQNTIVVGADGIGQSIVRKIRRHPEYGLNVIGFVDGDIRASGSFRDEVPILGHPHRLRALVVRHGVERVIFARSNDANAEILDLIRSLHDLDVQIDVVPRAHELVAPSAGIHCVEGIPLLGLTPIGLSRSSVLLKRGLDLGLTIPGLLLLLPFFAIIAVAIKLDSMGPVFFRQLRMGSKGPFRIWKFRTMAEDADNRKNGVAHLNKHLAEGSDPRMFKIDDDPRVTRVGRVLRRFSIDELPQLWNVVRGEMSLVGPRPLILEEHAHVADWAKRRLELKPGITGLWQVLGRDCISFEEMVKLDYLYVTSWRIGGDIGLILRTIPIVGRRT
jgi:exopolysaccharide biosynthesis polyprenyl glycosylphosphotransferase